MDSIKHIIGQQGVHTKYPSFLSKEECAHIRAVVDKYENDVMSIHNPNESGYKGLLTGQFHVFNWLSVPEIAELDIPTRLFQLDEIKKCHQLIIQCWCNTLRKDQGLILHRHAQGGEPKSREDTVEIFHRRPAMFYSSNIFLGGKHNKTWFETLGDIEHEEGDLMIFDNHLLHEVEKNPYDDTRYSMAFDIWTRFSDGHEQNMQNKIRYENPFTHTR